MGVFTSNTCDFMSGTFQVVIDDATITDSDTTFTILSVGELNIKYDTDPQEATNDTFSILIGEMDITCANTCGDGTLLSDKIDQIAFAEPASIQIAYTDRGGTSRDFRYRLKRGDYEFQDNYDQIRFTVRSLESDYYAQKLSGNPSVDDIAGSFDYITSDIGQQDAIDAYSFIDDCLQEINRQETESAAEAAFTNIIRSYERNSDATKQILRNPGIPNTGDDDFYVVSDTTDGGAYYLFARIAALHGAFWGTGFGRNWFITRMDDTDKVTLSNTDYKEFGIVKKRHNPLYQNVTVTVQIETISGVQTVDTDTVTEFVNFNFPAKRDLTVSFEPDQLYLGEYNGNQPGGNIEVDNVDNSVIRTDMIEIALDSYLASTQAELSELSVVTGQDRALIIEVEILGIVNLLPWQCFDFDTSVPDVFQNKTFRPSELKYNFEDDIVWVRAYAIRS